MARANSICCAPGCPHMAVRIGRCQRHAAEQDAHQRRTTPTKQRERHERVMRKRFVQEWIDKHGYWCPGYKRPAHASRDLTAEHTVPVADTARYITDTSSWSVLCRSCNSRHGAETRNQYQ